MRNLKSKGEKMKFINLLIVAALGATFSYAKEEVDCSDPKNRPDMIAGILVGGKKECYVNRGTAARAKRDLDLTIGRNPATGKVTSKAELLGGDKATNDLEKAQMNYGDKKFKLEEAEKAYADDPSTKNSNRLDKARKAFKKAQIDLKGAEEIKAKADMKKAK
jgi:putative lipoprotein